MSIAPRQKLYSFDDFCVLVHDDQKADLIDGVIYMASPENLDANDLLGWLVELLRPFIRKGKLGRFFFSRVAFRLDDSNGPEPDLGFVAAGRLHLLRRGHVKGAPDAAFEVVSPESVDRDYIAKRRQYEQAGVQEYWIIDEVQSRVTLLRLDRDGKYKEIKPRKGILQSKVIAGFWLRPAWLWQNELPDPDEVLREILAGTPRP
jgi:Uma2 family endonuclease